MVKFYLTGLSPLDGLDKKFKLYIMIKYKNE